ncbi:LytR C-terminal domain-containing protein [Trujillonella endophytica]|uniref:LytR C-terminal domain-containing protein n=1 Tax=Trujillonella endophytica TaxID=673521 RepID=UPI000B84D8C1|nr:LytR C-terminal domain-containing protein [Trujillella endophytica]
MNRRRTDAAAPPEDALPEDLGDHPTSPARSRADRRREGLLEAGIDPGRRPPRPGRPAPPEAGRPSEAGRPAAPLRPAAAGLGAPAAGPGAAAPGPGAPVPAAARRPRPTDSPAPARTRPPRADVPAAAAGARVAATAGATASSGAAASAGAGASAGAAASAGAGAAAAPAPAVAAGPRTTVAPFQAVPAPGPTEHPSAPLPDVSTSDWDSAWLGEPSPPATVVPATVVPSALQRPAESPRPPAAPPVGGSNGNPAYRDWTRPSGSGSPPATTAIPEREVSRGRASEAVVPPTVAPPTVAPPTVAPGTEAYVERFGDRVEETSAPREPAEAPRASAPDERRPARGRAADGSQTAVVGGRAALRAGRRAAEEERRRDAKRSGVPHVRTPVPGMEDDEPRPTRRRGVSALVAVVVLALLVLGVYSFTSPGTEEASDGREEPAPTSSAPIVTSGALPPLDVEPIPPAEEAPATPVRVPVTVLNATGVSGLAGDIADVLEAEGWSTAGTGPYDDGDVAATTVFFTEGDETQRQSALQLVEAHPEVGGPAVLFFEAPASAAGGLVVVAAGEWQP